MKASVAITLVVLCLVSLSVNSQGIYKDYWRELRFSSWFQGCLKVAQKEFLNLFGYKENIVTLDLGSSDEEDQEEEEEEEEDEEQKETAQLEEQDANKLVKEIQKYKPADGVKFTMYDEYGLPKNDGFDYQQFISTDEAQPGD